MDQPKPQQPRGNFVSFLNREKRPDNDLPAFVNGRIAKPGSTEEFGFALWPFTYTSQKTGEVRTGFNGRMSDLPIGADPAQQIDVAINGKAAADLAAITVDGPGSIKLAPGDILLFVSTPKERSTAKKPKAFYGYANFGDDGRYVDLSVWIEKDRYGRPVLSGNTQYPLARAEPDAPTVEALVDEGRVSRGMPEKKQSRGRGRDE